MKRIESPKKKELTAHEQLVKKASLAWQRAGYSRYMLDDMSEDELNAIIAMVDETGKNVDDFRERAQAAWDGYHEHRKAAVDEPTEDVASGFGLSNVTPAEPAAETETIPPTEE